MKAAVLAGPRLIKTMELDPPVSTDGSVVVRVTACGICGSDIHYWEAGAGADGRPDLVMGHEFAGVIEDAGARADLRKGDRVTVIPLNPCGECPACRTGHAQLCLNGKNRPHIGQNRPGAYAEYIEVRPDMVRSLPGSVSDTAAAMVEPAAVCLHAVRTSGMRKGDAVLVVGGGTIGLLCAAWARLNGASRVFLSEVSAPRLDAAARLAMADEVLDGRDPKVASIIKKATSGGVDIAIDASASDAGINTGVSALGLRGTLVLAGISLRPQSIMTLFLTLKEATLKTSFGYRIEDFEHSLAAIAEGQLGVGGLVSRTIGIDEVQHAFEDLHGGASGDVKVIIAP
ncbi:MAG TPA: alcohol dehydrogenase catalytic domain-containing protein [Deltaproteobacteria bacterium]|nr:alcohol dehydrogenase catalytic domain-containing protein [Deltaproteobacteria bacterium]HQI80771.1 alcohol dehydrogenase catalytic domain-containing protein [Deltaproteobacteria bacterium]